MDDTAAAAAAAGSCETTCAFCNAETVKYKCPFGGGCRAVTCSLPCFKAHKSGHEPRSRPQSQLGPVEDNENIAPSVPTSVTAPDPSSGPGPASSAQKESFSTVEVQALFLRFPGLRERLRAIYEVTLDPRDRDGGREDGEKMNESGFRRERSGRGYEHDHWSPEKGFDRGLRALEAAVDAAGSDAEGLGEFLKLVRGAVDV